MAKTKVDAPRTDTFIVDPSNPGVVVVGLDIEADESSVLMDAASNAAEIEESSIESMITVVGLKKSARKGDRVCGNIQAVTACRVPVDPSDPHAFVGKSGNPEPYQLQIAAGRRRKRAAVIANERRNLKPGDEGYCYILLTVETKASDGDAVHLRLIENWCRSDLNPVAEGAELKRLSYILAKQNANGGEPTKRAVSSQLKELAALKGESKASAKNKVNLSERLPQSIQDKIVSGEMPASAGFLLAVVNNEAGEPDHEAQQAIVSELADPETGRVKYGDVKQAIADRKGPKAWKPTAKNLRALSEELGGGNLFAQVAALALRVASGDAKREDLTAALRGHMPEATQQESFTAAEFADRHMG